MANLQMCNSCLRYKSDLNYDGVCPECYLETLATNLYEATKNCNEGDCNNCPRREDLNGSSNYNCRLNLIKDCTDFLEEFIKKMR